MDKYPKVIEGDGSMFNLEKFAKAGYEILGREHLRLLERARMRGMFIGVGATFAVEVVGKFAGWW